MRVFTRIPQNGTAGWLTGASIVTSSRATIMCRETAPSEASQRSPPCRRRHERGNVGESESFSHAFLHQAGRQAGKQYVFNGAAWVQQGAASSTEIAFLQAFIGRSGDDNEQPNYSST